MQIWGTVQCKCAEADIAAVCEHDIGFYFAAKRRFAAICKVMQSGGWMKETTPFCILENQEKIMPLSCVDAISE